MQGARLLPGSSPGSLRTVLLHRQPIAAAVVQRSKHVACSLPIKPEPHRSERDGSTELEQQQQLQLVDDCWSHFDPVTSDDSLRERRQSGREAGPSSKVLQGFAESLASTQLLHLSPHASSGAAPDSTWCQHMPLAVPWIVGLQLVLFPRIPFL